MRRSRNQKTKKCVAKRFKLSARGKVIRHRAGKRHLQAGKGPRRRRRLNAATVVGSTDAHRIKASLPFGL